MTHPEVHTNLKQVCVFKPEGFQLQGDNWCLNGYFPLHNRPEMLHIPHVLLVPGNYILMINVRIYQSIYIIY